MSDSYRDSIEGVRQEEIATLRTQQRLLTALKDYAKGRGKGR